MLAVCAVMAVPAHAVNTNEATVRPIEKFGLPDIRIAQIIEGKSIHRSYPNALPSLIQEINDKTTLKVDADPVVFQSFETPELFDYPFIFVNFADRETWEFSALEQHNLKMYLDRGGFIFVDAGINASFLRKNSRFGQHHSFADWEATPALQSAFSTIYPNRKFRPLPRDHELFSALYRGLPDPSILPETVREFVVNEKWPQGTYSAVGLHVNGRIAVLATPIISMGWGRNVLGNWTTNISFRIRESSEGLADYLQTAAYSGERYETRREDGEQDIIYCQNQAMPAWVNEPNNRWRVFRYYRSREISDFAHLFYTQLGVNILVYALTH